MPQSKQNIPLVGIDIGSTHVTAIVGDVKNRVPHILGHARVHNSGCRRGAIIDFAALSDSISNAVDDVERQSGIDIIRARVSVSGAHGFCKDAVYETPVIRSAEITQTDVARLLEVISKDKDVSKECIHRMLCYFEVDDISEIQSPLGFAGERLGALVHNVSIPQSEAINIAKVCNQIGIRIDGFVYEPLAAAEFVLDDDDKNLGAISISLGFEQTHVAAFANGFPIFSKVYPIGSNHITKDLAVGLRTTLTEAERVKREFGHACSGGYEGFDQFLIAGTNGVQRFANRNELVRIIYPRVHEIFLQIEGDLNSQKIHHLMRRGVVLSGGGAQLKGLCRVAEKVFATTARVGVVEQISGSIEGLRNQQSSAAVGLLSPAFSNLYGEKNCVFRVSEDRQERASFFQTIKNLWSKEKN